MQNPYSNIEYDNVRQQWRNLLSTTRNKLIAISTAQFTISTTTSAAILPSKTAISATRCKRYRGTRNTPQRTPQWRQNNLKSPERRWRWTRKSSSSVEVKITGNAAETASSVNAVNASSTNNFEESPIQGFRDAANGYLARRGGEDGVHWRNSRWSLNRVQLPQINYNQTFEK